MKKTEQITLEFEISDIVQLIKEKFDKQYGRIVGVNPKVKAEEDPDDWQARNVLSYVFDKIVIVYEPLEK